MNRPRSIFTGASIFTLLATAATASHFPAPQARPARPGPPSLAEIAVPDDTDFCAFFDLLDTRTAVEGAVKSEALAAFLRHAAMDAMEAGVTGDAIIEGEFVDIDVEDEYDPSLAEAVKISRTNDLVVAREVYAALLDTAPAY